MKDLNTKLNYARINEKWRAHHERYIKRVHSMKYPLICQKCRGIVGGPWEYCGWCEGTGLVTPGRRGKWLTQSVGGQGR